MLGGVEGGRTRGECAYCGAWREYNGVWTDDFAERYAQLTAMRKAQAIRAEQMRKLKGE